MNKKGFTLMELLVALIVMSFITMMIFPAVKDLISSNDDTMYKSYEKMMVEYARVSPKKTTSSRIMLSELDELKKIKDECKGYVDIGIDEYGNYEFRPYIKCGNRYRTCYTPSDCGENSLLN